MLWLLVPQNEYQFQRWHKQNIATHKMHTTHQWVSATIDNRDSTVSIIYAATEHTALVQGWSQSSVWLGVPRPLKPGNFRPHIYVSWHYNRKELNCTCVLGPRMAMRVKSTRVTVLISWFCPFADYIILTLIKVLRLPTFLYYKWQEPGQG